MVHFQCETINKTYYIEIKPDDKIEDIKRTIQHVSGLFSKK
jgi:biotin synthase-like enzyme